MPLDHSGKLSTPRLDNVPNPRSWSTVEEKLAEGNSLKASLPSYSGCALLCLVVCLPAKSHASPSNETLSSHRLLP